MSGGAIGGVGQGSPSETQGVGDPGLLESLIPFWGSGRSAINAFQNGRWGWGLFHSAVAVTDVFFVKSLATAGAKLVVSGVPKAAGALGLRGLAKGAVTRAINLPSWKKLTIDWVHIAERHIPGGLFAQGQKTVFHGLNQKQVATVLEGAYRNAKKLLTQGDRVLIRGTHGGWTVEMWINKATKTVETAYPVF
jgi:hypothetical protein